MRDRTDLPAEADGPQRPDMRSTPHQASPSTRPAPHRPLREPPRWAPCSATQALTHCIIRAALQHNTIVCPRARAQRTALVRVGASGAHVPPNARTHTAWRACATSPVCGMAPPAAAAVAALRSGPPASLARTQPYVCLAAAGESSATEHLLLPRDDGVVVTKHATRTIPGEDAPRTLNGLTAKAAARAVACLAAAVACLAILPLLGLAIALSLTVLLLWRLTVLLLWRLTVLLLAVAWLDLLLTITLLLSVSLLRLTILHLHGGSRCHTCWPHERCCGHRRGDGHRRGCDRGRER